MKKEHMWFFIIALISMIWYLSIEYLGSKDLYSFIVILFALPWVVIYLLICNVKTTNKGNKNNETI